MDFFLRKLNAFLFPTKNRKRKLKPILNENRLPQRRTQPIKMNAQIKKINAQIKKNRIAYNEVVDEMSAVGVRMRTGFKGSADGVERGNNLYFKVTGETPANGNGTCVGEAMSTWFKLRKLGSKYMCGVMRSRNGAWKDIDEGKGMPIYHCWVECGDTVYDCSNGGKSIMDKEIYYQLRRVKKVEEFFPITVMSGKRVYYSFPDKEDDRRLKWATENVRDPQRKFGYVARS